MAVKVLKQDHPGPEYTTEIFKRPTHTCSNRFCAIKIVACKNNMPYKYPNVTVSALNIYHVEIGRNIYCFWVLYKAQALHKSPNHIVGRR